MASKYWIKLYHEILRDPKMGRLPDNVWRRCIELFLLAGESGDDGKLPPLDEIAWALRQPEDHLQAELKHLVSVGILSEVDGGYVVTKFYDRQRAASSTERVQRYRERQAGNEQSLPETKRSINRNGSETKRSTVETEPEPDTDTEGEKDAHTREKSPPPDETMKKATAMAETIADICALDLEAIPDGVRAKVQQAACYLLKKDVDPEQVRRFRKWWPFPDAPYPSQVQTQWLRFEDAAKNGRQNGKDHHYELFTTGSGARPVETDAEKQRKLEAYKLMEQTAKRMAVQ